MQKMIKLKGLSLIETNLKVANELPGEEGARNSSDMGMGDKVID